MSASSASGQALPVGPPTEETIAGAGDRAGIVSSSEVVAMELTAAEEPQEDVTMGFTAAMTTPRGTHILPFDEERHVKRERHLKFVRSFTHSDSMYKHIEELRLPDMTEEQDQ